MTIFGTLQILFAASILASAHSFPDKTPVIRQFFEFTSNPNSKIMELHEISTQRQTPDAEKCLQKGISDYRALLDEVDKNKTVGFASKDGSLVQRLSQERVKDLQILFRDVSIEQSPGPWYQKILNFGPSDTDLRKVLAKFVFDSPAHVSSKDKILQISVTKLGDLCGISGEKYFYNIKTNSKNNFEPDDYDGNQVSSLNIIRNLSDSVSPTHWWNPLEVRVQQDESKVIFSSDELLTLGDKKYPATVDLTGEFGAPKDQLGGTCHIYAAVNLTEAACYRRIHKHLSISEAYLFYRHLVSEFSTQNSYSDWKGNGIISSPETNPFFNRSIDGGEEEDTLERINNGSVCLSGDFPFDSDYSNYLETISSQNTTYQQLRSQLNSFVQKRFQMSSVRFGPDENNLGFRVFVPSGTDLEGCLSTKLDVQHSIENDFSDYLELLSTGRPFLCAYDTSRERAHVLAVVGYRFNRRYPHNLEYKILNSYGQPANWGWEVGCNKITWIN